MSPAETAAGVLIVEDDPGLRELIAEELEEAGYPIQQAANLAQARQELIRRPPLLLVSDLRLPDGQGLELLRDCRNMEPLPPAFIMITAFGTVEQAVEALKQGADDFLTKPLKLDHLRLAVARALERRDLKLQLSRYRRLLGNDHFHGMIGRSPPLRRLFDQIRRIARASGPVLIQGESGVGKELVAEALHRESDRRDGPFVALNCAGIPADLLESELFGHAAGAFSGAQRARKGLFAEAEGGSLFLDELGEMPAAMQAKLLRILQDGKLRPVGENRERSLDVRIIAATNRDLEEEVARGSFRADLYYRLETFALEVPPLRQRGDDIDLLCAYFMNRHGAQAPQRVESISLEAMNALRSYPFPGNVRELSNAIERALAFCRGSEIALSDLPERMLSDYPNPSPAQATTNPLFDPARPPTLKTLEQRYVRFILEQAQGNKQQAARLLGIGRRTLYRHLEEE